LIEPTTYQQKIELCRKCTNNKSDPQRGLLRDKEIMFMKRITLILGVVTVMVAMIVALSAPAMAKDNSGHKDGGNKANTAKNDGNHNNGNRHNGINRVENQLDLLDNDFNDDSNVRLVSDVDFDVDSDDVAYSWYYPYVGYSWYYPYWNSSIDFDSDSDIDVDFDRDVDLVRDIDVDFDRDVDFAHGKNHNGNGKANGGDGKKGNGK
jgi:hypothetical protein